MRGVAPIDRLVELTWLGPASVVIFGLVLGLVAHAFNLRNFDRRMLQLPRFNLDRPPRTTLPGALPASS